MPSDRVDHVAAERLHRAPGPCAMRFVVDLQACQSEVSEGRGVGRYAQALAMHIARQRGDDDLRLCFNNTYAGALERAIDRFDLLLPRQQLSAYAYPSIAPHGADSRDRDMAVAAALVRRHWMSLQPDVMHVAHLFEGFHGGAVSPPVPPLVPGLVRCATLYDLIPLRFPEHYLADPAFKSWYARQVSALREFDHVLTISASTRDDAIELAGVDPERITVIWGGVDPVFQPCRLGDQDAEAMRARYGLQRKFVLYTGGDDHRKNLHGAIEGYAALPGSLRQETQLVIVCSLTQPTRDALRQAARKAGLGPNELLLPGFVPEADLAALYGLCSAFIFPSLYEGLGLPVIEAMSCGAPVLGADNSGVGEVIGRKDATFDARRPAALAERLARVLQDSAFRDELRSYGVERAREFSWERSAALALAAWREAHRHARPPVARAAPEAPTKRRLALFTPLPPARSGIADYSAAFLPHLARHFEIDVFVDDQCRDASPGNGLTVRSHREFVALRRGYDAVVYEMGNSEFHAYMLDYVARYPGVVILHDAYLSGLYGYVDFNLGRAGAYVAEATDSHGPRALRYLAPAQQNPDPVGASMINLPLSKGVIESAIGVISHTAFNIDVVRRNYPEGVATPYRVIKQIVRAPEVLGVEQRRALRASLGFDADDFVVCTFGHITWTKCGDVLLQAFGDSALSRERGAKLVFVGELARDEFGHRLRRAIDASDLRQRVTVTGYLTEPQYERYLTAADLAVQLRTHTRGGTSKAILDCLAHGLPVIANEAGSFTDYPADVIEKCSPTPDAAELAAKLTLLHRQRDALAKLGEAGLSYVVREHDPGRIAAEHALAIDEFLRRSAVVSLPATLTEVGALLSTAPSDRSVQETALALHDNLAQPLFARQRILVDVTHITDSDQQTGIQRAVRNIIRWLYCSDRPGFDVVAVRLEAGRLVEATVWLRSQGLVPGSPATSGSDPAVALRWGDVLLMLDSSWGKIDAYLPVFDEVRRRHGRVYSVIYDLLPIRFPRLFVDGGAEWFSGWLTKAIRNSDGLLCISRAVADELESLVRSVGSSPPARLGFWHLGCDFSKPADETVDGSRVQQMMARRSFLMVGTIEPRKNHVLALDAMELLWARGVDVDLCIAGKRGWLVEELMERLLGHEELGHRLHFMEQPADEQLRVCYARCTAVLALSAGEGFGLPLVEAAQFGTPVIASDIPVFREVAGEHATYVTLGSAQQLAADLQSWLERASRNEVPQSRSMRRLTWEQSAEALLDVVLANRWYRVREEATEA